MIGLLMSATTVLDIRRTRSVLQEELEQQGLEMVETHNDMLANLLYFSDVDKLREVTEVVESQPNVLYVQVFERDGRLLVDTRQGPYAQGSVEDDVDLRAVHAGRSVAEPNGQVVKVAGPMMVGPDVIGGIRLDLSGASVEAAVRAITIQRLWQTLALLVF